MRGDKEAVMRIPLLLTAFAIVSSHAATTGYWRFESGPVDNAAATIVDSSGNGHAGSPSSAPLYRASTPGGFPTDDNTLSLEFDGIDDVVEIAHSPTLSFAGSFTIEFWMKSPLRLCRTSSEVIHSWSYGIATFLAPDDSMNLAVSP